MHCLVLAHRQHRGTGDCSILENHLAELADSTWRRCLHCHNEWEFPPLQPGNGQHRSPVPPPLSAHTHTKKVECQMDQACTSTDNGSAVFRKTKTSFVGNRLILLPHIPALFMTSTIQSAGHKLQTHLQWGMEIFIKMQTEGWPCGAWLQAWPCGRHQQSWVIQWVAQFSETSSMHSQTGTTI